MAGKIKGYTTLEILMILAMLSILGALFVREFLGYIQSDRLKSAASEIASEINFIRTKSMILNVTYGFCYNETNQEFIFFEDWNVDKKFTSGEPVIKQLNLPSNWSGINVPNPQNRLLCPNAIVFDRRGEILGGGDAGVTITFQNTMGERISVIINSLGRISLRYGS